MVVTISSLLRKTKSTGILISCALVFSNPLCVLARPGDAKMDFTRIGNLPVLSWSLDPEVIDFTTAALVLLDQVGSQDSTQFKNWDRLVFIAAPDALTNDSFNTDYLNFLTEKQKRLVRTYKSDGAKCYFQPFFDDGGVWSIAASSDIDPELQKRCFLLSIINLFDNYSPVDFTASSFSVLAGILVFVENMKK